MSDGRARSPGQTVGGCGGRALLQRLQRQPDGGVELGIAARCPVVRCDCHLDIRVRAVVVHAQPASANHKAQVRYALSPVGQTLASHVSMLINWAEAHRHYIAAARHRYDTERTTA